MSFQQKSLAEKDEMALNFERKSAVGRTVTRVACRALPIVKTWVRFQTILCQIFGGQWHLHRLLSEYVRLLLAVLSHQSFILIRTSIIDAVQSQQLIVSLNEASKRLSMSGN
jgi:hypothetical protein